MQVRGLPGYLIRSGEVASRLLAARPQISKRREDATPCGGGARPWPTALPADTAAKAVGVPRATLYAGRSASSDVPRVRIACAPSIGRRLWCG
jgi:hypothetical protein